MVSAETRTRIVELADRHEIRPNQIASRLRRRRTGIVGVVVPLGHERRQQLSDPFFMALLAELADLLAAEDYDLMLSRVVPNDPSWLDRVTGSGMLDGVMLIGQSTQHDVIERVAREFIPLVAWGCALPGQVHCAVGTDNRAGGMLAANHLIDRGAVSLAFLGEVDAPEFNLRFEGVVAACDRAGLATPHRYNAPIASPTLEEEVGASLRQVLASGVDGLVCMSDVLASTVLNIMLAWGVEVPGTLRVVGFDDLPLARHTVPPLTTVKQDLKHGAKLMVNSLMDRLNGFMTKSYMMEPLLIARSTS